MPIITRCKFLKSRPKNSVRVPTIRGVVAAQLNPRSYYTVWETLERVRASGLLAFRWAPRDRAAAVGPLAGAGLIVAAALSVFGMPPVSIHPPLHYVGVMDPFCGMTRGVAATVRGDFATAWRFNPASPLVIAGLVAAVSRSVMGATTGRWLEVRIERPRVFFVAALVFFVVLEINQQMHADLLR